MQGDKSPLQSKQMEAVKIYSWFLVWYHEDGAKNLKVVSFRLRILINRSGTYHAKQRWLLPLAFSCVQLFPLFSLKLWAFMILSLNMFCLSLRNEFGTCVQHIGFLTQQRTSPWYHASQSHTIVKFHRGITSKRPSNANRLESRSNTWMIRTYYLPKRNLFLLQSCLYCPKLVCNWT